MDQKEIDRTRYFELKKQLEEASRLYYKDGVSPMSDQDFDFGLKEMEALEAKYPELRGKDSLTQRVGSDLTNDFAKVTHTVPMLSIANVYSAEEMAEFVKAAEDGIKEIPGQAGNDKKAEWICERKIDGVSLSIVYENGRLKQAATRGDGVQGDDVTLNALTIADIPETLDAKKLKIDPSEIPQGTFEVRGEVYMEREAFERLNEQFILEGKKIFQNPRNTVSGSLKLKSVAECKTRPMRFFAYHIPQSNNKTHEENLQQLKRLGFHTNDYWKADVFRNLHDFIDCVGSPVIVCVESKTLELLQVFFVRCVVALRNVVCKESHRTRLAFGNALEFERTRNRIAAVLERFLVFENELFVQTLERFAFHVDFTAYFECPLRNFARVNLQLLCVKVFGNVGYCERIQSHVIALSAVTTCRSLLQTAVLVNERKTNAINLAFANPLCAVVGPIAAL